MSPDLILAPQKVAEVPLQPLGARSQPKWEALSSSPVSQVLYIEKTGVDIKTTAKSLLLLSTVLVRRSIFSALDDLEIHFQ